MILTGKTNAGSVSDFWQNNRERIYTLLVVVLAIAVFIVTRDPAHEPTGEFGAYHSPAVGSYGHFLQQHVQTPRGTAPIAVDLNTVSGTGFRFETVEGYHALVTDELSETTLVVNVPTTGLYNIHINYFPIPARGIDIERSILINGESQFDGSELVAFSRVWGDSPIGIRVDSRGNQTRPPQIEMPRWESTYLSDRMGFFSEPYQFLFQAGSNEITMIGINEPMAIRSITLTPVSTPPTFAEFMAQADIAALGGINQDHFHFTHGIESTSRSSPSLFAQFDSSSGGTYPASSSNIVLNMIGGIQWRMPGQWLEWEVEVPHDGLYRLTFAARQNHNRGFVSSRTLTVNGVAPFAETQAIPFAFDNNWDLRTLSAYGGEYLLFPLTAGTNTIRLEVTLGELGEIIDRMLASVQRLNLIHREILILTGPSPDVLRDYRVDYFLPHVMDAIRFEYRVLFGIVEDLIIFTGERNEHAGLAETLARQLQTFSERPDRIPVQLVNFRENISALGDAARVLTEGPLDINYLIVSGVNAELPTIDQGFFVQARHEISSFINSFTMDFDTIGDAATGDQVIEVWLPTGRDQANIIMSLIDADFTPNYGIGVNLRLVDPGAVLPAVVAGIGPDVALSLPSNMPVQYALRGAAVDLTQFPDFWHVMDRFHESAIVPFELDGGYWAIPETQGFPLMFYRADILESLGLEVPNTWDDVLLMLPTLQRNNMNVGVPTIMDPLMPDISGLLTQLYQRDGFLYNDDHSRTILDSEESIAAFEFYTRFFTHHGTPAWYNFVNRFRSGEIPIGFADFGNYNVLSVFAPEIRGQWNFGLMPGYVHPDGSINRSVPAHGLASMIFSNSDNQDAAWTFLKWWTSAEAQLNFGREMESIMGAAARYNTANLEAFNSLSWSAAELLVLNEQRDWIVGTPEVPGGYYVHRHIINASRRVINDNVDTRETLLDFVIVINRELERRRIEFGLE